MDSKRLFFLSVPLTLYNAIKIGSRVWEEEEAHFTKGWADFYGSFLAVSFDHTYR